MPAAAGSNLRMVSPRTLNLAGNILSGSKRALLLLPGATPNPACPATLPATVYAVFVQILHASMEGRSLDAVSPVPDAVLRISTVPIQHIHSGHQQTQKHTCRGPIQRSRHALEIRLHSNHHLSAADYRNRSLSLFILRRHADPPFNPTRLFHTGPSLRGHPAVDRENSPMLSS